MELGRAALEATTKSSTRRLERLQKKRRTVLKYFNNIRKCLEILLNEKMCRMAIVEDSLLQDLLNDYAHVSRKVDRDSLSETLNHVQELFKAAHHEEMKERVKDYQTLIDRLSSDSFLGDAYYDKEETIVEKLVDDFMVCHAPKALDANIREYNLDYLALLKQMETYNPAILQKQEDEQVQQAGQQENEQEDQQGGEQA